MVRVEYNTEEISLSGLLGIFFEYHDPTTPNRQGRDVGSQYRSAIFYYTESQHEEINAFIRYLEEKRVFDKPINTEVRPAEEFYRAEEYHQKYYAIRR